MSVLLRCSGCGSRNNRVLNQFEERELRRDGSVKRFCGECLTRTRWQSDAEVEAEPSAPLPLSQGVLVIGNNGSHLREIQNTLESCGAEAEIAFSLEDAMTRIIRHDFDLIVSEHRPPEFDAARVVRFIREHRPECIGQLCFIPSETVDPADIRGLMQHGAVHWSVKQGELLQALKNTRPEGQDDHL